jgi:hypothetical protein
MWRSGVYEFARPRCSVELSPSTLPHKRHKSFMSPIPGSPLGAPAAMKASIAKLHSESPPYLSLHILEDGSGWYSRCLGLAAPNAVFDTRDAQAAGDTPGHELRVLTGQYGTRLAIAFAAMVQQRADVLLVGIHPFFRDRPEQVITLAAHHIIGRPSLLSAARAGILDRRQPVGWDLGVSTTADCHRRPRRACAARAPIAVATPACRRAGKHRHVMSGARTRAKRPITRNTTTRFSTSL